MGNREAPCKKCGSEDIGGLYASFWVPLTPNGAATLDWHQCEAETFIGHARLCYSCGHQWGDEEDQWGDEE
jgi:hypothetical protein